MPYELRVYTAVPGRMPKLLARFKDRTTAIWQKHKIVPIGFWTTLIGPDSASDLTYILAWAGCHGPGKQIINRFCGTQLTKLNQYNGT
jgi:NIPSNAP